MDYKLLQLTNNSVGVVAVNGYMPLGVVTGRINCPYYNTGAIYYTTSANDTIIIGNTGHYKITYNASIGFGAGTPVLSLLINGTSVYSITQTITDAGTYNFDLVYEFKIKDTLPSNVQIQLTGIATTSGNSNIIIEKVA